MDPTESLELELLRELELLDYLAAEGSFAHFTQAAWRILEPDTTLHWGRQHDAIAEYMTAVHLGQLRRLIINVPPRNMKSILCSVSFPAWTWIKDPGHRFICSSYSGSLSTKLSIDCRTLIESPWYQRRWAPRFKLATDQNQKGEFSNDKRGHRIATSTFGTATGKGCNTLLIDDPHDTTGAESDTERVATINTFRQKFTTRLDDKKEGRIVIVMQRLHDRDLTGELMTEGGYENLCLPAIAERKTIIVMPISKTEIVREPGDILHPEREGAEVLAAQKIALGSKGFQGQYQQDPVPPGGTLFKREWWKYYDERPMAFSRIVQFWDCAQKVGITNDYSVCATWMETPTGLYLLDVWKNKVEAPQLEASILSQFNRFQPNAIVIEDKSSGSSVIQNLRQKTTLPIIAYDPKARDKQVRAIAATPTIEAGNCYIPRNCDWGEDFILEHQRFPNASHDDQVDTTSMMVEFFRAPQRKFGIR